MEDDEPKKGGLMKAFKAVAGFVAAAALGYLLMLPVETWVDAARTSLMHSTGAEAVVASSTGGWGGDLVSSLLNFFNGNFVSPETAAAFTPDSGAIEALTSDNAFSADSVFGAGPN